MKITIDTKEDSHEDIMKVMQILHHIVQKGPGDHIQRGFSDLSSTKPAEPTDTTNMMSMFANPSGSSGTASSPTSATAPDTAPNFGSFLNLTAKEEKKEDPKVEFF